MAGEDEVVAGSLLTEAQAAATSVLPDRAKSAAHSKTAEPGSAG